MPSPPPRALAPTPSRMLRRLALLAGVAAAGAVALPVIASAIQDHHRFDVAHEQDERMEGTFSLALGRVTIGEADRGQLFQARIEMEDDRLTPSLDVQRTDGVARLRMGVDGDAGRGVSFRGLRNRHQNTWKLSFDRRTPLDLRFDLGLTDADLDLTGLRVERLRIAAGMADARLAFGRRNAVEMQRLDVDAGAARFTAEQLGNARFHRMTFSGGAGSFELDFSGARLPAGARADVDVGISRLRILLPENRPVVLHAADSWLTRVDVPDGYTRQSRGVWHSPGVAVPEDAFHLHVRAGLGRVSCETVSTR